MFSFFSSSPKPNKSICPAIFFFVALATSLSTASYICSSWLLRYPSESNAPDFTKPSSARRLSSFGYMRSQKSSNDANAPLRARSSSISLRNPRPTLRIAARPNRILPSETVKPSQDVLTSGGRTLIPMPRAAPIYSDTFGDASSTLVSSAAIYSCG